MHYFTLMVRSVVVVKASPYLTFCQLEQLAPTVHWKKAMAMSKYQLVLHMLSHTNISFYSSASTAGTTVSAREA